ncbi:hypothetical protein RS81_01099 [Microbacterium terrae]|uniref:Uncharacterized protein n=1 Tax=Microbacterium terrae TaxID=69369 RepID=A0A0M2H898_9MICO|nr:hypothetical protein RS81_01099 [Microbacterium terrae]
MAGARLLRRVRRLRAVGELGRPDRLHRREQPVRGRSPRRAGRADRRRGLLLPVVAVPHLPHHRRRRRGAQRSAVPHAPACAARPRAGREPHPADGRARAGYGQARGGRRRRRLEREARIPVDDERRGGAGRHPPPGVGAAPRRGGRGIGCRDGGCGLPRRAARQHRLARAHRHHRGRRSTRRRARVGRRHPGRTPHRVARDQHVDARSDRRDRRDHRRGVAGRHLAAVRVRSRAHRLRRLLGAVDRAVAALLDRADVRRGAHHLRAAHDGHRDGSARPRARGRGHPAHPVAARRMVDGAHQPAHRAQRRRRQRRPVHHRAAGRHRRRRRAGAPPDPAFGARGGVAADRAGGDAGSARWRHAREHPASRPLDPTPVVEAQRLPPDRRCAAAASGVHLAQALGAAPRPSAEHRAAPGTRRSDARRRRPPRQRGERSGLPDARRDRPGRCLGAVRRHRPRHGARGLG